MNKPRPICDRWIENQYIQLFTGEELFQHEFPHDRSGLSHWHKRSGNKLELLLAETLRVTHDSGALCIRELARVTVDTTAQPKNITLATDTKLVHAAIKGLNRLANQHDFGSRNRETQRSGAVTHQRHTRDNSSQAQRGACVGIRP